MVEIFKGKEIDNRKISILKNIAYRRYNKQIYNEYFADIHTVEGLAGVHGLSIDNENLVLGTDWFLCYTESNNFVVILEWVSIDNDNIIKQTAEMMSIFKKIFLQNKEKFFVADMRDDTSYVMYLNMLQKGYFQEFRHEYIIDCAAPIEVYDLKNELLKQYNSVEDFLKTNSSKDYSYYYKYILHHISFMLTNKFIKKYSDPSRDNQGPVLEKKK